MVDIPSKDPDSRSREEVLIDRALLLHLIDESNKFGRMDGHTKLEKIVFATEKKLNQLGKKFLNYGFFTYHHGPFSKGVKNDINHFHENDLVKLINGKVVPTDRGEQVINMIRDELRSNEVMDVMSEEVQDLADLRMSEVKKLIYSRQMEVNGELMEIGNIPKYTDVLEKLSEEESEEKLELDEETLETIEHLMDKKTFNSVQRSVDEIKKGNLV
jgi:hypothetical protein